MCEESACLVPPLADQSQNGSAEPRVHGATVVGGSPGGSGNGIGVAGGQALVGFHEDALSQAAVGRAQLLLAAVLGLALAADCGELVVLGFVLPAAELQLCIGTQRKHWLGAISLLALAIGSAAWGVLGDRLGRRRALVSALGVAALFSTAAAVMPTYGTFMTARFCSGIGIAGAVPLAFSYLSEVCPRATRTRYTGLLHSFWPLGGLFTSTLAHFVLPSDGEQMVQDNREHWSSWHRLLLFNTLPSIACIIGLIWASESPRYLLEASREVEALQVYQRFHRLNKARTQYGLTELELPSRNAYRERPGSVSPAKSAFGQGLETLRDSYLRILSPPHMRTTILLACLHMLIGFCYMGIATFAPALWREMNEIEYAAHTRHINDANYTGELFNGRIENARYTNCVFQNVTFQHVVFNHVNFVRSDFLETDFSDVKSSKTYFANSTIHDCRFIDTDLTEQHFISCNMSNNTFLTLASECNLDFDYNIYLEELFKETLAWAVPMIPVLIIVGFVLCTGCSRPLLTTILLFVAGFVSVGLNFLGNFLSILFVEGLLKILLMGAMNTVVITTVESYPCHLRCTAHGLLRCLFHIASLLAIPLYTSFVGMVVFLPSVVTLGLLCLSALLASGIPDNGKVLL